MDAWRTSCPRLPVWERSPTGRGFVQRLTVDGVGGQIALTEAGRRFLQDSRP
jgi:D-3-phosphoglycerate dehydrogenase / 2-oxoglutarate reductase